jgi:transcriptional regulator with XRE-family HTH domain
VSDDSQLGARLRELRQKKDLGLREVANIADVNHGYLSQLERGEVSQPAPQVLQKLAKGYGVPFAVLMDWAGYVEAGLSPNQERALSYLGEDVSDEELTVVQAVLDALRKRSATFAAPASLDGDLSPDEIARIRQYVLALLDRADALDLIPTPINQVMDVARLVSAGEVTLEPEERRKLRRRFGDLVDRVWHRLQGVIHFRARQIWVNPDMYPLRKRFVYGHEIGHYVLPEHREWYAHLDDERRLRADIRDLYERQANQAAIELLAQGDRLRREADDSTLTMDLIGGLADRYAISMQATARRIVEETRQDCALAVSFRALSTGRLMPHHLYCSQSFEQRFRWKMTGRASSLIEQSMAAASRADLLEPLVICDMQSRAATLELHAVRTPRAVLVLFRALPTKARALKKIRSMV